MDNDDSNIYGVCPICGIFKNNLFETCGEVWNRCDDHRLFWIIDGCYNSEDLKTPLETQIKEAVFLSENNYYRCDRVSADEFQKNIYRSAKDIFIDLKNLKAKV